MLKVNSRDWEGETVFFKVSIFFGSIKVLKVSPSSERLTHIHCYSIITLFMPSSH